LSNIADNEEAADGPAEDPYGAAARPWPARWNGTGQRPGSVPGTPRRGWSGRRPRSGESRRPRVTVSPGDVRELARVLRSSTPEATEALVQLARQAKRTGWWKGMSQVTARGLLRSTLSIESTARGDPDVRGPVGAWPLADRGPTARAILRASSLTRTPEQVERQVQTRMLRQQILTRTDPQPPAMWAILDEAVIRRMVGGRGGHARPSSSGSTTSLASKRRPCRSCRSPWGAHIADYGSFAGCSSRATQRFL